MKLKTTQKISLTQSRQFEDEQGAKGIKKLGIFSQEDCYWELEVGEPTVKNGFKANVKWFQLQDYDTGDGNTATMPVLMFSEDFTLDKDGLNDLFNAVGISIIPPTDFDDSFNQIVTAGVFHWIGTIRNIFGLDASGFEVTAAQRPSKEEPKETQKIATPKSKKK